MRRILTSVLILLAVLASSCGTPAQPTPTAPAAAQVSTATSAPVPATTVPEKPASAGVRMVNGIIHLPEVNPLQVRGDIIAAGSSTVFPLSERIAERFKDEGFASNITIDSIGSGAGYERFCKAGESDIANASRPIKASEVDSCKAIGRDPFEIRVGTDAVAVVVSKENTFLTNVTKDQLAQIFSTAAKWSDVDPSWPNEDIRRFIPGTDSGTFDFFVEEILAKDKERALSATNQQLSEDDNVLVQGILGSPYAIGYFGYAYYVENADKMNAISINGVAPTVETVDQATYLLARPIFMYTTAKILQEKPQVAAFINFYLTHVNEEISTVGYFPANSRELNKAKMAWANGVLGPVQLPEVNPLQVRGDIIAAGSSTVFPLSERIAERFKDEGFASNITIDSIGSGAGYERFCKAGESDIANASRPIKASEVDSCKAIGRDPFEIRVGTDAVAVVVSKENTFLTNVTKDQLAQIFSTAAKWSDVDPSWPNEDIRRFIPGTDSGTFDFFVEEILAKDKERALSATNQQLSEDDNVLVQGILGSPYAIGYFGYAYYVENADKMNAISINGVAPTVETVDQATYLLARPIFMYTTAKILQEKPQVAAFINFYLTHVNEEISTVGYFPANAIDLGMAKLAVLEALGN